ncbi:hypothetical protein EJB05_09688, partial [Eragrostis curvula]
MAKQPPPAGIDPRSGFCAATRTFHSLREPVALPPESLPTTAAAYAFSVLPSPLPDRPAFIDAATGVTISYPSFLAAVRSLAGGLWSTLGVPGPPGGRRTRRRAVPVLDFALMSIGAVVSPANPASTVEEYAHQAALSKPVVAFAAPDVAAKLPLHLKCIDIGSDEYNRIASSSGNDPPPVAVKQSDTAAVLYSSGTTGRVKAVTITHGNLIALLCSAVGREAIAAAVAGDEPSPPPPMGTLFPLPLFHVFGFTALLRSVCAGGTAVLMHGRAVRPRRRAARRRASDEARRRDLSSLLFISTGGAPLHREVAERFAAIFPHVQIVQGYGLTEASGAVAWTAGPEECKAYGSVGKLASHVEAKVVHPATGEALRPGQRGELWMRGPSIMKGKTGDLCYFDEDGFLFIVDRLKELIKYKGYQVPPAELEHILLSHPEIVDAAVVPYPDEDVGQLPMAFVVRKPSSNITEQQIMGYVAKHVAPYKKVRRLAFISAIPKSPAGKILRRQLVQQALSMGASKL